MFIKNIKGTYGIFKNEEFSFKNGLNIIQRDNEWGKTTLISFIKTMFYGVNTSKRDKKDFLSEKTKYVSNVDFAGEMCVEFENRDILVSRSQSSRSMNFDSYYLDYNQKTPFTSKDFGNSLLGVSEDVFANTALIEAENRLITKNSDLLDLIIAMSTTGDTTKSFDKALKILKEQKQILIKANGSLSSTTQTLEKVNEDLLRNDQIELELINLNEIKAKTELFLEVKREEYENKYRLVSYVKLELLERANIIKSQSDQIIANLRPDFFEMHLILDAKEKMSVFEQTEQQEYDLRLEVNRLALRVSDDILHINHDREAEIKENSKVVVKKIPFSISIFFGISTFFTTFFDANLGEYSKYSTYILAFLTLIALITSFSSNKDHGDVHIKYDEKISDLELELEKLKEKHKKIASKIESSFEDMTKSANNIGLYVVNCKEDVRSRINYVIDINDRYLKAISFEENTKDDTDVYNHEKIQELSHELENLRTELNECERNFQDINEEILRSQINLDSISSKNQLLYQKDQKETEINLLNSKIMSIDIAIEALILANENLTSRLSPEISKIASEYFAFLTDDKYNSVVLQSDFEAFCKNPETYSLLSKLHLSSGTKEQLYFALRLAICDVLIDKNTPIILDDPFVFYDDTRMEKALDLLKKISSNRQILLFTCHSRLKNYLENI